MEDEIGSGREMRSLGLSALVLWRKKRGPLYFMSNSAVVAGRCKNSESLNLHQSRQNNNNCTVRRSMLQQ